MKTLHLDADELALNFDQCLKLANAAAEHLLEKQGGAMLLSFWDNDRGLESPHGVSECHFQCPISHDWRSGCCKKQPSPNHQYVQYAGRKLHWRC